MNEKIIELALKAGIERASSSQRTEVLEFAELIVQECLKMCKTAVGNKDYNTGRMHCYDNIKQHFEIEE
jgi:hypothetical protein